MKTIDELKLMQFIPLRECSICKSTIGWYNNGEVAWFDSGCDCASGGGHYDTWEIVEQRYNQYNPK